jgi:hypothetical protein
MNLNLTMRTQRPGAQDWLLYAKDGLSLLIEHEGQSLAGLQQEWRTRRAVARRAASLGELLRDQIDLIPASKTQLANNFTLRGKLLLGLMQDLRVGLRQHSAH